MATSSSSLGMLNLSCVTGMFKSRQFMEQNDTAISRRSYLESKAVSDAKSLVAELCRLFYTMGWVLGTGGSVSLRVHEDCIPRSRQFIVMSPSGVQKERMASEDIYVLSPDGIILSNPTPKPYPNKPPKCSDCASLFMKVFEICNAGAVIHSHGIQSCLITMINPSLKEFRITNMEMIKGIKGHSYSDELVIPIIENAAHERELTEPLTEAIKAYPKATAVLVRNHGVYVWGDSWISAKTQAECYHYLFDAAIKLHQLGLDWSAPSHGPINNGVWGNRVCALEFRRNLRARPFGLHCMIEPSQRCVLLNIDGVTSPTSFVSDVLFPYIFKNVGKHLATTYESEETQRDIDFMRSQIWNDLEQRIVGPVPIPPDYCRKELVIKIVVEAVEFMLKSHRKVPALNQLLGHIWKTGFQSNDFVGVLFEDVPEALKRWYTSGTKVYVYSSYSRQVQQLLFANSNNGDLRKYFSGFFDTALRDKNLLQSFSETFQTVGVDNPADILYVTSDFQEAVAARAAGYAPGVYWNFNGCILGPTLKPWDLCKFHTH